MQAIADLFLICWLREKNNLPSITAGLIVQVLRKKVLLLLLQLQYR